MEHNLENQKILLTGLGLSGMAAARLALAQGAEVTVLDDRPEAGLEDNVRELRASGATVHCSWRETNWPAPVDLAVVSPGITPESPLGKLAGTLSCPILSELELGYRFCHCPIIAITGTNGKTTTTELLTHCLRGAGYRVEAGGNIGRPLSDFSAKSRELDFLVVEVSSFQLEHVSEFTPAAATILNITPDHYDRHGGPEGYLEAKLEILRNLSDNRHIVLRSDLGKNPIIRKRLENNDNQPLLFSGKTENGNDFFVASNTLCERDQSGACNPCFDLGNFQLKGRHNWENALAVLALARAVGIDCAKIAPHLGSFRPTRHRLETVAELNGIRFVNDSKATNVDALIQALETISRERNGGNVLLIAGGLDKDANLDAVKKYLKKDVKAAFLIGTCRKKLEKLWKDVVSCQIFESLEGALQKAIESARLGDIVLLSPGCSSLDMFRSYAHRGDTFCNLIKTRARK